MQSRIETHKRIAAVNLQLGERIREELETVTVTVDRGGEEVAGVPSITVNVAGAEPPAR